MKLLTLSNPKSRKGESFGYLTGMLMLSPSDLSGVNLCPYSSAGCRAACLNTSGRGAFAKTQWARLKKTSWFLVDRTDFINQLRKDIKALIRKAARENLIPCVRLNGTSDIPWERIAPELFAEFPDLVFYDYTKWPEAARSSRPSNYYLTQSYNEELPDVITKANLAVVFKKQLPLDFQGKKVIDGTEHDLRFLDEPNVIVGLIAKGKAKRDTTGFVIGG
jgi:hypothetical protein